MNHREAQALIMPFIEGNLDDESMLAFIDHVEHCSECYDELEVYYIVIVGVKQLDDDAHVTNFHGELNSYIAYQKDRIEKKRTRKYQKRILLTGILGVLLVLCVSSYLRIYNNPDIGARYVKNISTILPLNLDLPEGNTVSFTEKSTDTYFSSSEIDMPLRLISSTTDTSTSSVTAADTDTDTDSGTD